MPNLFEVLAAVYEVSTVVTDVILNGEYIKRGWFEEYVLSITFLVFSGLVMSVVGMAHDAKFRDRFTRNAVVNGIIAFVVGMLQLRVLMETLWTFVASSKTPDDDDEHQQHQQLEPGGHGYSTQRPLTHKEKLQELQDGLVYVTFIQGIVRDVPIFIIQANATIHYRKWKLVDLWAVVSTGVTLVHAVITYVNKKPQESANGQKVPSTVQESSLVRFAASLFLVGQFVFRLGAILLVAMTTGTLVVYYSLGLVAIAMVVTVVGRFAYPAPKTSEQLLRAVLFFPFFAIFSVDASRLTPRDGSVLAALAGTRLWLWNVWRFLENTAGVALAVVRPRYVDFGRCSDKTVLIIGASCGLAFVVSWAIFFLVVRSVPSSSAGRGGPDEAEDTTRYMANHPPEAHAASYSGGIGQQSAPYVDPLPYHQAAAPHNRPHQQNLLL